MSRKGWNLLSPGVRSRYERAGVSRGEYESGTSLAAARGHGKTPERPSRAKKSPNRYRGYLQRTDNGMRVITSQGVITVFGMGSAERSLVGSHENAVKALMNSGGPGSGRKPSVVPFRNRKRAWRKPEPEDFRNLTVTGYRVKKGGVLETFELETDPSQLGRLAYLGELDFTSVYEDDDDRADGS